MIRKKKAAPKKGRLSSDNKSLRDLILKKLECTVFIKPQKFWLDIGNKYANAVWGSAKLGLPAGKMYQFAGKKHGGKSAFVAWLSGLAQRQHKAFVVWIDAENSFDRPWMKALGMLLGSKYFYLVYPKVLKRDKVRVKGKLKKAAGSTFLQSAEYLMKEAEEVCHYIKEKYPNRPIVVVIDSIANLQPEMVLDKGYTDQNMRSMNMERAQFLSTALPRWVDYAKNYSMWMFNINQVRTNPAVMFGDNEYSPGGKALEHNCHVMGKIRRKGEGFKTGKKEITGYMVNVKNKAGGGSLESQKCSYKISFGKSPEKIFNFSVFKAKEK